MHLEKPCMLIHTYTQICIVLEVDSNESGWEQPEPQAEPLSTYDLLNDLCGLPPEEEPCAEPVWDPYTDPATGRTWMWNPSAEAWRLATPAEDCLDVSK